MIACFHQITGYSLKQHALEQDPKQIKFLVIPGGNFTEMKPRLIQISEKIENLVLNQGTPFLGICAGAIAASKNLLCEWSDSERPRYLKTYAQGLGALSESELLFKCAVVTVASSRSGSGCASAAQ